MKKILVILMGLLVSTFACASLQKGISLHEEERWVDEGQLKKSPIYFTYLQAQWLLQEERFDEAIEVYREAIQLHPKSVNLLKEISTLLVRQGQTEEALKYAEQLPSLAPDDPSVLLFVGRLYAGAGHSKEAINIFERAFSLNPYDPDVCLLLGTIYAQMGIYDKAVDKLNLLTEILPDNPLAYYYKARVFLEMKLYDQAEQMYIKALQLDPYLTDALLDLSYLYEITDQHDKAIDTYKRILSYDPDNAVALERLGNLFMRIGRLDDALRVFEHLSQVAKTGDLENKLKIGIIHLKQRSYEKAIHDFTALLKEAPEYDQALFYLATAYEEQGNTEQAILNYRLIPPSSTLWKVAQIRLAFVFAKKGEYDAAVGVLRKASDIPDEIVPEFFLYMAVFREEQGKVEEALYILEEGLEKFPQDLDLLYRKGIMLDKLNRKDDAILVMKHILEIDPDNAEALNYIGYTYADQGIRLEEAEKLIKSALKQKPDDGYILDSMAWVYFRMGKYKTAQEYIDKALNNVPDDPIITDHAADIYRALGNVKKALYFYQKAIDLGHEERRQIENKIEEMKKIFKLNSSSFNNQLRIFVMKRQTIMSAQYGIRN